MKRSDHTLLWLGIFGAGLVALSFTEEGEDFLSSVKSTALESAAYLTGIEPRGYRNNNPGNLKPPSASTYQGQIGLDEDGFGVFSNLADGYRALMLNAQHQFKAAGANTLNKLGAIWAPTSDGNASTYGADLAKQIFGVSGHADDYFNPSSAFLALAKAISVNENGYVKDDGPIYMAQDNALAYLGLA